MHFLKISLFIVLFTCIYILSVSQIFTYMTKTRQDIIRLQQGISLYILVIY